MKYIGTFLTCVWCAFMAFMILTLGALMTRGMIEVWRDVILR